LLLQHSIGALCVGVRRGASALGSGARSVAQTRRWDRREFPARLDRDAHDYGRRPADRVLKATEHKLHEQTRLRKTDKFKEGVKAVAERRVLNFTGR